MLLTKEDEISKLITYDLSVNELLFPLKDKAPQLIKATVEFINMIACDEVNGYYLSYLHQNSNLVQKVNKFYQNKLSFDPNQVLEKELLTLLMKVVKLVLKKLKPKVVKNPTIGPFLKKLF